MKIFSLLSPVLPVFSPTSHCHTRGHGWVGEDHGSFANFEASPARATRIPPTSWTVGETLGGEKATEQTELKM